MKIFGHFCRGPITAEKTTGAKVTTAKEVKVKPQPAKTVVKAFCVAALKQQIWADADFGSAAI